jgi:hypothetical protein
MNGYLHAPSALPQGKSPWYPLDRRLGGPQCWSERSGKEIISVPAKKWTLVTQPVTIPTELPWPIATHRVLNLLTKNIL